MPLVIPGLCSPGNPSCPHSCVTWHRAHSPPRLPTYRPEHAKSSSSTPPVRPTLFPCTLPSFCTPISARASPSRLPIPHPTRPTRSLRARFHVHPPAGHVHK
ncbi:hypothetical protein DENSPDRAFT_885987 [Dentipellis sp. KUC8613]|nr:hypothetical protein DENSPDRAFT_880861 [Dentipellis sp. KUC8613]KAA1478554.1 hypothetical protein DENSPDRAFT_885987 [Dentipellis sp. KUC8613]